MYKELHVYPIKGSSCINKTNTFWLYYQENYALVIMLGRAKA